MKKYFPRISTFLISLVFIFAISGIIFPQTVHASFWDVVSCTLNPFDCALRNLVLFVVSTVLQLVSLLTGLSGIVLNGIIYYTVVDVSNNYTKLTSINVAWGTIRDIANMGFIFVLLYAAIQTILGIGSDTKKLIVRIVIVAILINFSLFFTKIIIDISNVLALLFYDAIAPGAASAGFSLTQTGLSNAFMQHLTLQSLYQTTASLNLGPTEIITIGVMGSIMLLVAAFVFFAAAIMFVIRYVILILVLILSPLAFMGWVLPGLKKYWDQWWNALSGQAFFAPIYFMLTWISLQVLKGIMGSFGAPPSGAAAGLSGLAISGNQVNLDPGTFAMFINFIVVIVFLITALIVAKEWANKVPGGINKLTSLAMGGAIGGAALVGRHTIGRGAAAIADSERLKEIQEKGGAKGMAARLTLAAGRKTSESSMDIRGVGLGIGGAMGAGKAGGKSGFADFRKKQAEAAEKRAKGLGPSQETLDQAEQEVIRAERTGIETRIKAAKARLDQLKGVDKKEADKRKREVENRNKENIERDPIVQQAKKAEEEARKKEEQIISNDPILKKEKELEEEVKKKEAEMNATLIPELKTQRREELELKKRELETAKTASEARKKQIEEEIKVLKQGAESAKTAAQARRSEMETASKAEVESITVVQSTADRRKQAYANLMEKSIWARARGYNLAAAAQIRRGKSKEKKLVEAYKDATKDEPKDEGADTETSETSPPTPPAGGTPTT